MSARKRQRPVKDSSLQLEVDELDKIFKTACEELQQHLDTSNIGAAKRTSFFLSKISESYDHPLEESVQNLIRRSDSLMLEWKRDLKANDLADFLSPTERKWFSIKIISFKSDKSEVFVHYQGWDSKYDQWFPLTDELVLLPPFSIIPDPKRKKKQEIVSASTEEAAPVEKLVAPEQDLTTLDTTLNIPPENEEGIGRGSRRAKKAADSSNKESAASKKPKEKAVKVEKDHNDWFCTNCGMLEAVNGTDLVLCDGLCRRSFHLECLSKAEHKNYMEQMTASDENVKYYCEQCRKSKHSCFLCDKVGIDYLDVVRCSSTYCGKYYHISCLTKSDAQFLRPNFSKPVKKVLDGEEVIAFIQNFGQLIDEYHESHGQANGAGENDLVNVDVQDDIATVDISSPTKRKGKGSKTGKTAHSSTGIISVPGGDSFPLSSIRVLSDRKRIEITDYMWFRCPRHFCDTCYEFHGHSDKADLCHCHYCPRAFHSNCIPPASRYNSVCMVCPLHPNELLPGDASLLLRSSTSSTYGASKLTSPSRTLKASRQQNAEDAIVSQQIASFFEQLIIPDALPDVNNILDNHYRLPLYVKNEVDSIPPTFTMIARNNWDIFPADKTPPLIIPDSGCDCREECGSNCFNFVTRVECCSMRCRDKENPILCKVGKKDCGNRALQNREYVKTKVFQEGSMGLGLKADEDVSSGKLVIEYLGEIIDEDEMVRRMENQRVLTPSDKEYYIMELYDGVYVDGKHQGNVSRYINHSCNPNCELQRWNVHGKIRIGIVAIRDIAKDEALSYDYQFDTQQADVFKCYCGSHNCRGTMAPKKDRRAQLTQLLSRSKLLPNASNTKLDTTTATTTTSSSSALTATDSEEANKVVSSVAVVQPAASWMTAARVETAEERELRIQLVREAREKERNRSIEEREAEELTRSYVNKFLPGDSITEIKHGPLKSSFRFARQQGLFLVRNIRPNRAKLATGSVNHLFLSRRERVLAQVPEDWYEKNAVQLKKAAQLRQASISSAGASVGASSGAKRKRTSASGSSGSAARRSSSTGRGRKASGNNSTELDLDGEEVEGETGEHEHSTLTESPSKRKRGRPKSPTKRRRQQHSGAMDVDDQSGESGAEEDPFAISPASSP